MATQMIQAPAAATRAKMKDSGDHVYNNNNLLLLLLLKAKLLLRQLSNLVFRRLDLGLVVVKEGGEYTLLWYVGAFYECGGSRQWVYDDDSFRFFGHTFYKTIPFFFVFRQLTNGGNLWWWGLVI